VWEEDFVNFRSRNARDPGDTVLFFQDAEVRNARLPIDDGDRVSLVNALAKAGRYQDAWNYYASFRHHADRRSSRDPDFAGPPTDAAVFDWQLADDPRIYAAFQKGAKGGMVDFTIPPSMGGIILRQLQVLPPGTYRLEGWATGIDQPKSSSPYWILTCLDGRGLGRVVLSASGEKGSRFAGRFVVPPGCPVQSIFLLARASNDINGVSGQIEAAQLRPVDSV
jgi:hypothetical protein